MAIRYTDGRIEHVGRVLKVISKDERIMSDVYALVRYAVCVQIGTGAPLEVRLGDCEFGQSGLIASWELDATEAAICEHAGYVERADRLKREREYAAAAVRAKADREREAKAVRKGRHVRVVRGRKVPKGTEGVCIWVGDGTWGERCGIKDAAGVVHWTASKNVEAIDDVHTRPTVRPGMAATALDYPRG